MLLEKVITDRSQLGLDREAALAELEREFRILESKESPEQSIGFSSLYLTGRCHLKCIHCHAEDEFAGLDGNDAPIETLVRILNRLSVISNRIQFTGGEIFTRVDPFTKKNDTLLLLREASIRNIPVILSTTGMHLTDEIMQFIVEMGNVEWFSVSLDGPDAESNSLIRRNDTSFERSIEGIELIKKYGFKVKVGTCLTAVNADLENMRRLGQLMIDLGVDNWKLTQFYGREVGRASGANSAMLRLSDDVYWEILNDVQGRFANLIPRVTSHSVDVFHKAPAFLVQPNGLITTLEGEQDVTIGNILLSSPLDILNMCIQMGYLKTLNENDSRTY